MFFDVISQLLSEEYQVLVVKIRGKPGLLANAQSIGGGCHLAGYLQNMVLVVADQRTVPN